MATEYLLETIHQCVVHSTIRHVMGYDPAILVEYLTTYPFYRGADTLYYLLLKKVGVAAYYAQDGTHVIHIQPELAYVYVLAEQEMQAPMHRDRPTPTINSQIRQVIARMPTCKRFKFRHAIITGEAKFQDAVQIPSIALNIPKYQIFFQAAIEEKAVGMTLVANDCLEPIPDLRYEILMTILERMAYLQGVAPNLWQRHLQAYYTEQLLRLKIHTVLPRLSTRQIYGMMQVLPDVVRMPNKLSSLGVRLWFSHRAIRAYLLGFDITDGLPSDAMVSQAVQRLSQFGIEQYVNEITGIHLDADRRLTGMIGINYYPHLVGKKLGNTRDQNGLLIGSFYSCDIVPIINEDTVTFISLLELALGMDPEAELTVEYLRHHFTTVLAQCPSDSELERIKNLLALPCRTARGRPARTRLVEINAYDMVDYQGSK